VGAHVFEAFCWKRGLTMQALADLRMSEASVSKTTKGVLMICGQKTIVFDTMQQIICFFGVVDPLIHMVKKKEGQATVAIVALIAPSGLITSCFGPSSKEWEALMKIKDKEVVSSLLMNGIGHLEEVEADRLYPGMSAEGRAKLCGRFAVSILSKRTFAVGDERLVMLKVLVPTDAVTYPEQILGADRQCSKLLLHTSSQAVLAHGAVRWVLDRWVDLSHGPASLSFTCLPRGPGESYSAGAGAVELSFRPIVMRDGHVQ
jgi:hypothetical protein